MSLVSEISTYSKSFVKMCSYERAGWFCSRDLSFSNWDLGNKWAGNVATWTLITPVTVMTAA